MPYPKPYTKKELKILKRKDLSSQQVADMIGRTENAVHQKRLRIARDYKKRKQQGKDFTKKLKKVSPNFNFGKNVEKISESGICFDLKGDLGKELSTSYDLPLFNINGVEIIIDKEHNEITITY